MDKSRTELADLERNFLERVAESTSKSKLPGASGIRQAWRHAIHPAGPGPQGWTRVLLLRPRENSQWLPCELYLQCSSRRHCMCKKQKSAGDRGRVAVLPSEALVARIPPQMP